MLDGVSLMGEPDPTQRTLLSYLQGTRELMLRALRREGERNAEVGIRALPDLGLPSNVGRLLGGFATGAWYGWQSRVPFVVPDATLNSCAVSVYRLRRRIETLAEFETQVTQAKRRIKETPYEWNLSAGNHFATIVSDDADGGGDQFLVMHASGAEYKEKPEGLYPYPGVWYYDSMQRACNGSGRTLRYLYGTEAERFIRLAQSLPAYNSQRHDALADLLVGEDEIDERVAFSTHYGMPTQDSIAIGCVWDDLEAPYPFLTRSGESLYMVKPLASGTNRLRHGADWLRLAPHGLGMVPRDGAILSIDEQVRIGSNRLSAGASLTRAGLTVIRSFEYGRAGLNRFFGECPIAVESTLYPQFSCFGLGGRELLWEASKVAR